MLRMLIASLPVLLILLPVEAADRSSDKKSSKTKELHVVCLYEGVRPASKALRGDVTTVQVDRPGQDVVLYLDAYDIDNGLEWTVKATDRTHLSSVILGGNANQTVTGLDGDTRLIRANGRNLQKPLKGYYRIGSLRTRQLFRQLVDRTQRTISSFHGIYRPDGVIHIDTAEDDPRLDAEFPQVDTRDAPDLKFKAVYYAPSTDGVDSLPSLGDWSLKNGPDIETLHRVPENCNFHTWDADGEQWYGLHETVFALHPRFNASEVLPGQDRFRFKGARGLAIDSKRNRLLILASGELYACTIDEFEWTLAANVKGFDVNGMCYHQPTDSLYGIYLGYDGNSHTIPRLVRLNMNGAVVSDRRLHGPFLDGMISGHGNRLQFLSAEKHLVMIVHSAGYDSGDGSKYETRTYVMLIDPDKATARVTWKNR